MKTLNPYLLKLLLIGLALIVSSCTSSEAEPTPDLGAIVAQTQTAIALDQFLTSTAVSAPSATPAPTTAPQETQETPPSQDIPECSDRAEFISETVPDGSTFAPGQTFEKSWSLRNAGTCTWTNEYKLVFDSGERMGEIDEVWLSESVSSGGQINVTAPLTAPQVPGDYIGYWKLQNELGERFGLGENADVALWVNITVSSTSAGLKQGPPAWEDTFDGSSSHWYLGSDSNTSFEIDEGRLIMTALKPAGDQWRVAQPGYLEEFYLEAEFTTGSACAGKDSYGLLVRAPDQPDSIIDSGYVFVASCDGHFRAYLMQNGNFVGLVNWAAHSGINTGPNQTNRIGVKALGSNFQLYINDALVTEFTDGTYGSGLFGLSIRSEVTTDFRVIVDRIAYWLPD